MKADYGAFHRVVAALRAHSLVRDDPLRAGLAASFGPRLHVHRNDLPDMDKLRSLMLDFRKLVAEKEPSNLNAVHNLACGADRGRWSAAQLSKVQTARAKFRAVFDQPADMYRITSEKGPTVQDILDDWINGDWFHQDDERRAAREAYEIAGDYPLSLHLLVPALKVAIEAATELDEALCE
jgi:hypothetical protein